MAQKKARGQIGNLPKMLQLCINQLVV